MKYFENINSHKYVYLGDISEPRDNSLRLVVEEAGESKDEESLKIGDTEISGMHAIKVTEKSCIYEVIFDSYIGYSVLDESFAFPPDDSEEFEGRIFRIYSKSNYLNYINKVSFACSEHPVPFNHYSFNCLNHCVEVVSAEPPIIRLLNKNR